MSKHETEARPIGPATQARLAADLDGLDGYAHEPSDGGLTGAARGRKRQYHTSIEEEVIKELDELGRKAGLSRAAMLRLAVIDGVPLVRRRFRAVP